MVDAMGTTTTSHMTFAQFERLPDEPNKLELIDGEVIRMPPAFIPHSRISKHIFKTLDGTLMRLHAQGLARELGEVFMETGYQVGPGWLQPDVSVTHAGQSEDKYLLGAPALAIEIVSRRNTVEILKRKVKLYMEHGGREAWLWYPRKRVVVVHRGTAATQVEGKLTTELLPGVTLDLEEIFSAGQEKHGAR